MKKAVLLLFISAVFTGIGSLSAQKTFRLYINFNGYKGNLVYENSDKVPHYFFVADPSGETYIDLEIRRDMLYEIDTGTNGAYAIMFNRDANGVIGNVSTRPAPLT